MDNLDVLTAQGREAVAALVADETATVESKRERVLAYGRVLLAIREQIPSAQKFNAHLKANGLEISDPPFRSNAMWIARYWDALVTLLKHDCPYSDPAQIRQWLRDQERVAKGLPARPEHGRRQPIQPPKMVDDKGEVIDRRGASPTTNINGMLTKGWPLNAVKAAFLYGGAESLAPSVTKLERRGWVIEHRYIPYREAIERLGNLVNQEACEVLKQVNHDVYVLEYQATRDPLGQPVVAERSKVIYWIKAGHAEPVPIDAPAI